MKVSIDRIEEGIAVLVIRDEHGWLIPVPVSLLPPGCGEGDFLTLTLERDPAAAAAAKERVSRIINKVKKDR